MPKLSIPQGVSWDALMATARGNGTWGTIYEQSTIDVAAYQVTDANRRVTAARLDGYDMFHRRHFRGQRRGIANTPGELAALGTSNGVVVGETTRLAAMEWICTAATSSTSEWEPTNAVVSVRDFGDVGDGGDDTDVWNEAVAFAAARGMAVVAPPLTYRINTDYRNGGSIRLLSNSTIVFSPGAVIQAIASNLGDHAIFFAHGASNIHVSGGTVIGDRYSHTDADDGVDAGHGYRLSACADVLLERQTVQGCWGDGVYVRNGTEETDDYETLSERIELRNLRCESNRRTGIAAAGVDGMTVYGCALRSNAGANPFAGANFEPNVEGYVRNITVIKTRSEQNEGAGFQASGHDITYVDCIAWNNGTDGFRLLNTTGGLGTRITIQGGRSQGNLRHGVNHEDAIDVTIGGGFKSFANVQNGIHVIQNDEDVVLRLKIEGASFQGNGGLGAYISDAPDASLHFEASGNGAQGAYIEASDGSGLLGCCFNANGGHNLQFVSGSGYRVEGGVSTNAGSSGVLFSESASLGSVSGMHVHHNGTRGIHVQGDNIQIRGNTCHSNSQNTDNTYDNIEVQGDGNIVDDNVSLRGSETNRPRYAIRFGATANVGNILGRNVTAAPDGTAGGASGQISDNGNFTSRTISATVSISFPSVTAGSYNDQTTTVSGAAVGDTVTLGPPAGGTELPAGFHAFGFVSATNTVTVRMINNGGTADPVTATWRVSVSR